MKNIISFLFIVICLVSLNTKAEMSIAGYLGISSSSPDSSGSGSYTGKSASDIGAILLLPIAPALSLRTSLAMKTRKLSYSGPSFSVDTSENLLDLGLAAQFEFPITDLYVFAGAKMSSALSIDCNSTIGTNGGGCGKASYDYPVFAGLGYNAVNFGPAHIGLEAEYEQGFNDISTANQQSAKHRALAGRVFAKFGF